MLHSQLLYPYRFNSNFKEIQLKENREIILFPQQTGWLACALSLITQECLPSLCIRTIVDRKREGEISEAWRLVLEMTLSSCVIWDECSYPTSLSLLVYKRVLVWSFTQ